MLSLFRRRPVEVSAPARQLVAETRFELVPMKTVDTAIADLAPGSAVSVTCSPTKGLIATQELTARLLDLGHDAVPHLSARLVEGPEHVARLAQWLRRHGRRELFVIAGDAEIARGPYPDGISFLGDLLEHDTGLARVGVPAYPDGHPFIEVAELHDVLHAKQALLDSAGVAAYATTQLCLDPVRIRRWLTDERSRGLTVPVELGIPGVVDRTKLMRMGVRLGIGASLRFLRKNRATVTALLAPGGYDPTELVTGLADDAVALGISGLHAFTFNAVAETRAWQQAIVA